MNASKYFLGATLLCLVGTGCAQQTTKSTAKGLQRIHFDFDKSFIKAEYEPTLKDNAAWLKKNGSAKVTVEGHCDERGTNEYNIALGDRRASSAKNYLENLGITNGRLSTVSYGEEKGICSEAGESCWWQNRRAEFVK